MRWRPVPTWEFVKFDIWCCRQMQCSRSLGLLLCCPSLPTIRNSSNGEKSTKHGCFCRCSTFDFFGSPPTSGNSPSLPLVGQNVVFILSAHVMRRFVFMTTARIMHQNVLRSTVSSSILRSRLILWTSRIHFIYMNNYHLGGYFCSRSSSKARLKFSLCRSQHGIFCIP